MTEAEKRLFNELSGANSLELLGGSPSENKTLGASIANIVGNPPFKGEISMQVSVKYYSQAVVGTPVEVAPAALPAGQKTTYPLVLFGEADYESNFAKTLAQLGSNSWDLSKTAVLIGGNSAHTTFAPLNTITQYLSGSIANNRVQKGDLLLIIPMVGFVAGAAGTTVSAEILIHCNNVAYASLIASSLVDFLQLNMIRYVVDPTQTAQLQNPLLIVKQSTLGKTTSDTLDPNTYVTGGTYNKNIADIPLSQVIGKNISIGSQVNYDVVNFTLTMTLLNVDRFGAK